MMFHFFHSPKSISQSAFFAKQNAGDEFVLIDVRRGDEYVSGSIPGAVHIALDEISDRIEKEFPDKQKEYIVFCRTQGRSPRAARIMEKKAYKNVRYLLGGYNAWSNKT